MKNTQRHEQRVEDLIPNYGTIESLKDADRTLIVAALRALHRERCAAYSAFCTIGELVGKPSPIEDVFDLAEVNHALRRIGAEPMK